MGAFIAGLIIGVYVGFIWAMHIERNIDEEIERHKKAEQIKSKPDFMTQKQKSLLREKLYGDIRTEQYAQAYRGEE